MPAVPPAVDAAVQAAGLRLLHAGDHRTRLHLGRRATHTVDVHVMAGPSGGGAAESRTLVLAAPAPTGLAPGGDSETGGVLPDGTAWWWVPHDPALPGLAAAADREHVSAWLGGLGELSTLRWHAYRPLERAVLAATWRGADAARGRAPRTRDVYLKALPPTAVHPLHRRLRLALAAGVPVPPLVAPPHLGVLALGPVPGVAWRSLLTGPSAAALDPREVEGLLDRLPAALLSEATAEPTASSAAGTEAWVELLEHAVWSGGLLDPAAVPALERAAERARLLGEAGEAGPLVPVHGDLHPGNLHVDPSGARITGLLDADTLGPGHRVDDWAALLGHLRAARADLAGRGGALDPVIDRFHAHAAAAVDPTALAARVGVLLLALAADPEVPAAAREARRAVAAAVLGSDG